MTNSSILSDAERMDRHYRYQRFIYDGTRTHYLIGRRYLINNLKPNTADTVLEIGCGTAWNLIRVARLYPYSQIFGLDVSKAMLLTARHSLERHKLSGLVELKQGNANSFDPIKTFGIEKFDRIFFSYALSMIPSWKKALEHAFKMLASGGEIHIVDFGQCDALPSTFKKLFFHFLEFYTVYPRKDMKSALEE
ncbi:MAG: class I SAM-dependent methyltransferase, partial [Hyphomicrobium sp.]